MCVCVCVCVCVSVSVCKFFFFLLVQREKNVSEWDPQKDLYILRNYLFSSSLWLSSENFKKFSDESNKLEIRMN